MRRSLVKTCLFILAAVLCAATLLVTPATTVDAQSFAREEVIVPCDDQGSCYATYCQLSTVQSCNGFTPCYC